MKVASIIIKIVAALAAVAGVVFVIATYGDKIVAWAKKMLGCCPGDGECECLEETEEGAEDAAEEIEEVVEEANEEPIAAESDFE